MKEKSFSNPRKKFRPKKPNFDKSSEIKICGVNAVKMVFLKRSPDVIRLYTNQKIAPKMASECRILASQKKAYHLVSDEELEKISGSHHHEGVCAIVKAKPILTLDTFLKRNAHKSHLLIVVLDGVKNPHNIGAIIRTMAHFGANALLVTENDQTQNSACYRTAEGGLESVDVIVSNNLVDNLKFLITQRFEIIATSSHSKNNLFSTTFSPRTALILGEEKNGISDQVLKLSPTKITIPGTKNVESLNVSNATTVILSEYWRQKNEIKNIP